MGWLVISLGRDLFRTLCDCCSLFEHISWIGEVEQAVDRRTDDPWKWHSPQHRLGKSDLVGKQSSDYTY